MNERIDLIKNSNKDESKKILNEKINPAFNKMIDAYLNPNDILDEEDEKALEFIKNIENNL